ncbi:hypothetical protein ACSBR2_037610 [Camellia fascicularis]
MSLGNQRKLCLQQHMLQVVYKMSLFKKVNYVAVKQGENEDVNLDDVHAVFDDIEDQYVTEQSTTSESGPLIMNAFEMITLSQGLNLSPLFGRRQWG